MEEGSFMTLDQNSGLESSYKNNRHGWIKGENGLYEEIPGKTFGCYLENI